MKIKDLYLLIGVIVILSPFFLFSEVFLEYERLNKEHGMIMSFVKFAILATFGETIGSRIKTGNYLPQNFGLIPRAIIWGLLGFTIKLAFDIFTAGTISFLTKMGWQETKEIFLNSDFTISKLFIAFCISAFMNLIYAPVMMTLHKITDMHIVQNFGKMKTLYTPIKMKENFVNLNWGVQWGFVFKKTIPFFWIPAHTITFILPEQYRVLFAAILGIALGIIMAIASIKGNK